MSDNQDNEKQDNEKNDVSSEATDNRAESDTLKDKYSIINYLIKTPSILIAAVSGLVAICSFLVDYAAYLSEANTLRYWNIDLSILSGRSQLFFYHFCATLVLSTISVIASMLIGKAFQSYVPFATFSDERKKRIKALKKEIKEKSNLIRELIRIEQTRNVNKRDPQYEAELKKYQLEYAEMRKEINSCSKSLAKERRSFIRVLFSHIFITAVMFFLVCLAFFRTYENSITIPYIVFVGIVTLGYLTLYCLINWLLALIQIHKNKKKLKKKEISIDNIIEEVDSTEYPLERISRQGIKSVFTNFAIISALASTLFSFLLTAAVSTSLFPLSPEKTLKCVTLDNVQYVAVYTTSTSMVLEEADIDGDTVRINTSKQLITPLVGTSYETITFEKVEKTDSK